MTALLLDRRVHDFTARTQAHLSSKRPASACRTELLKRVDEVRRQPQEHQGPQQKLLQRWDWHFSEGGGPGQLQEAMHSSNVEVINIIMKAFEDEPGYL